MDDSQLGKQAIQACVANARRHLAAARALESAGANNMAFNVAVLALEEVGKAILIRASRTDAVSRQSDLVKESWLEDHEKKLFWALWSSSFGKRASALTDFQEFPHIASEIHLRRLSAIYVDPKAAEIPAEVSTDDVRAFISLAEYAIASEEHASIQELNESDRADLHWFVGAGDDPNLAGVIFGKNSFDRLTSFQGDVRRWVKWLRIEVEKMEQDNEQLAREELEKAAPSRDEELTPKWSLRARFRSPSHSVRGKPLTIWNRQSRFVKLAASNKHDELFAEFLIPKKVSFAHLGQVGLGVANAFAVAISVATRGFFWWYLPGKTVNVFEQIRDLERGVPLAMDSPILNVAWGRHVLGEAELLETLRVYAYLQRTGNKFVQPYMSYRQGLALVAKNDIHERFEPTILRLFYLAFRQWATQQGDWDGRSPFLDCARTVLGVFHDRLDCIARDLPPYVALAESVLQDNPLKRITLRDAIMMKLFCDLYVSRLAHESLGFQLHPPNESSLKPNS